MRWPMIELQLRLHLPYRCHTLRFSKRSLSALWQVRYGSVSMDCCYILPTRTNLLTVADIRPKKDSLSVFPDWLAYLHNIQKSGHACEIFETRSLLELSWRPNSWRLCFQVPRLLLKSSAGPCVALILLKSLSNCAKLSTVAKGNFCWAARSGNWSSKFWICVRIAADFSENFWPKTSLWALMSATILLKSSAIDDCPSCVSEIRS